MVVIGAVYFYQIVNKRNHREVITIYECKEEDQLQLDNFKFSNHDTGRKMPDCLLFDKVFLSTLIERRDRPVLVLRIKESNCGVCVDNAISLLEKHFNEMDDRIIILSSWSSMSEKTYRMRKKRFCMYNVSPTLLEDLQVDNDETPYFFLIHPNMKISNTYRPEKAFNELTNQYLENLMNLLSD